MISESANSQTLPAVHVLSIARGTLVALVLAISAPATATLFGVPQFAGSFAIAASIPLVTSFSHLGIKQVQRNYVYLPDTLAIVFANISALLILVPAILIFHDHRAIIASFMTEASVYVVASHALAREQYLVRSDRVMLRAALEFGFPLLVNGIGPRACRPLVWRGRTCWLCCHFECKRRPSKPDTSRIWYCGTIILDIGERRRFHPCRQL